MRYPSLTSTLKAGINIRRHGVRDRRSPSNVPITRHHHEDRRRRTQQETLLENDIPTHLPYYVTGFRPCVGAGYVLTCPVSTGLKIRRKSRTHSSNSRVGPDDQCELTGGGGQQSGRAAYATRRASSSEAAHCTTSYMSSSSCGCYSLSLTRGGTCSLFFSIPSSGHTFLPGLRQRSKEERKKNGSQVSSSNNQCSLSRDPTGTECGERGWTPLMDVICSPPESLISFIS